MATSRSSACCSMQEKIQIDTTRKVTTPTRRRCIRPYRAATTEPFECSSSEERDWTSKTRFTKGRRWHGRCTAAARRSPTTLDRDPERVALHESLHGDTDGQRRHVPSGSVATEGRHLVLSSVGEDAVARVGRGILAVRRVHAGAIHGRRHILWKRDLRRLHDGAVHEYLDVYVRGSPHVPAGINRRERGHPVAVGRLYSSQECLTGPIETRLRVL